MLTAFLRQGSSDFLFSVPCSRYTHGTLFLRLFSLPCPPPLPFTLDLLLPEAWSGHRGVVAGLGNPIPDLPLGLEFWTAARGGSRGGVGCYLPGLHLVLLLAVR